MHRVGLKPEMSGRAERTSRTPNIASIPIAWGIAMMLVLGCGYTQVVTEGPSDTSDATEPSRRAERRPPRFGNEEPVRLDREREACELALLATGHVEPSDRAWRTIRDDLENIREYWSAGMPEIRRITYQPVFQVTALILVLDFAATQRVRERDYHEWDELNQIWGAEPGSLVERRDGRSEITLVSSLCLDMTAAIDDYRFLYGVDEAYPPRAEEDGPTIYAIYDDFERRYVFRDAWGSCQDGCDQSRFAYFKISGLAPHLQETYDPQSQSPPIWWEEAREIVQQNRDWERARGY